MDIPKFGERLAIHRQNKNMTQEEFASRAGVTAQAVSKWERGLSLPDISLMKGICDILDLDANEILDIKIKSRITESNDVFEQQKLLSSLCAEPIRLIFGKDIIPIIEEGLKTRLIADKRIHIASEKGFLVPIIHMIDDSNLKDKEFCIISYDKILYSNELNRIDDSTFTYIVDILFQVCVENYDLIINKQIVKTLIDNVKTTYPGVADELVPEKISYLFVQKVLEGIIRRNVSIHNLIFILKIMEEEVQMKGNYNIETIVNKIISLI